MESLKGSPFVMFYQPKGRAEAAVSGAEQELKFSSVVTEQEWLYLFLENLQAGSCNCTDI